MATAPESARSDDRQLAEAHRQLGLGLEVAGDIAGATGEFEAALELGPWPVDAAGGGIEDTPYGDLARICWRSDAPAAVVRACTRAIASLRFQFGALAELITNRADAYRRLGETDRALADYEVVLKIETSNPRALLGRGLVRAEAGDHFTAVSDLRRAIAGGLDRPDVRYARALSLAALGRFEAAITDYDQVLSDPEALTVFSDAYRHRAEAHCQIGEADAAAIGWQVWLATTPGGAAYVQEMLWAHGYLRGAIGEDFHPAALAALRAWTQAGCPPG